MQAVLSDGLVYDAEPSCGREAKPGVVRRVAKDDNRRPSLFLGPLYQLSHQRGTNTLALPVRAHAERGDSHNAWASGKATGTEDVADDRLILGSDEFESRYDRLKSPGVKDDLHLFFAVMIRSVESVFDEGEDGVVVGRIRWSHKTHHGQRSLSATARSSR